MNRDETPRTFTSTGLERTAHDHEGRRHLTYGNHDEAIEIRASRPLHGDKATLNTETTYEVHIGTGYTANDGGYTYEEIMWGEPLTGEDALLWIKTHTMPVLGTKGGLRLR